MEINTKRLCSNEVRKVALLITKASDLGMDISGYGFADVNPHSGNVYLWLEDYPFALYIAPCNKEDYIHIYANWINPYDGEEHDMIVSRSTDLNKLHTWCARLQDEAEKAEA